MIRTALLLLLLPFVATTHAQSNECPSTDIFERLQCEQDLEEKRLAIETVRDKRAQLTGATDGPREFSGGFPSLLRVFGKPGDLTAQFSASGGIVNLRVGESVAGWSLSSISSNSVTLAKARDKRVVLLAGNPAPPPPAQVTAPAAAAPVIDIPTASKPQ